MRSVILTSAIAFFSLASANPLQLVRRQSNNQTSGNQTSYGGYGNAGYTGRVGPPNATCTRQYYNLTVTSQNTVFQNVMSNANETILTSLLSKFVAQLPASMGEFTQDFEAASKQNVTGTYVISGTLCTPTSGDQDNGAIQLLVHGIGFDSSYWDFAATGQDYSYVSAAAQAGHTTFRYDRLGTGLSQKPEDTYNVVQAATDVAVLTQVIKMLQTGAIGGKNYTKIAGVGHSYGSVQVQYITQTLPTAFSTVILTGYSVNTTFVPVYLTSTAYSTANIVNATRFPASQFPNGYLITLSPWTNQLNFAYWPYYTNEAFALARATEQPVTQGVLFTFGGLGAPASSYNGNVHVVTGDKDWIFCGQKCIDGAPNGYASIPDVVKTLYPSAKNFSTYIPENVGHAIEVHVQAPQVNQEMLSYLKSNFY